VSAPEATLLIAEYHEVNAHLRANTRQFVNWFSFFLTFSFIAAVIFAALSVTRPELWTSRAAYGVEVVFLLMHILALTGIVVFRRYIVACHCKVEDVIAKIGLAGDSPIPVRFCKWMTDLMAAGFVISYFTWFAMLFAW
jgi:uncharacterized membrane protein YagU involved in acid resistance